MIPISLLGQINEAKVPKITQNVGESLFPELENSQDIAAFTTSFDAGRAPRRAKKKDALLSTSGHKDDPNSMSIAFPLEKSKLDEPQRPSSDRRLLMCQKKQEAEAAKKEKENNKKDNRLDSSWHGPPPAMPGSPKQKRRALSSERNMRKHTGQLGQLWRASRRNLGLTAKASTAPDEDDTVATDTKTKEVTQQENEAQDDTNTTKESTLSSPEDGEHKDEPTSATATSTKAQPLVSELEESLDLATAIGMHRFGGDLKESQSMRSSIRRASTHGQEQRIDSTSTLSRSTVPRRRAKSTTAKALPIVGDKNDSNGNSSTRIERSKSDSGIPHEKPRRREKRSSTKSKSSDQSTMADQGQQQNIEPTEKPTRSSENRTGSRGRGERRNSKMDNVAINAFDRSRASGLDMSERRASSRGRRRDCNQEHPIAQTNEQSARSLENRPGSRGRGERRSSKIEKTAVAATKGSFERSKGALLDAPERRASSRGRRRDGNADPSLNVDETGETSTRLSEHRSSSSGRGERRSSRIENVDSESRSSSRGTRRDRSHDSTETECETSVRYIYISSGHRSGSRGRGERRSSKIEDANDAAIAAAFERSRRSLPDGRERRPSSRGTRRDRSHDSTENGDASSRPSEHRSGSRGRAERRSSKIAKDDDSAIAAAFDRSRASLPSVTERRSNSRGKRGEEKQEFTTEEPPAPMSRPKERRMPKGRSPKLSERKSSQQAPPERSSSRGRRSSSHSRPSTSDRRRENENQGSEQEKNAVTKTGGSDEAPARRNTKARSPKASDRKSSRDGSKERSSSRCRRRSSSATKRSSSSDRNKNSSSSRQNGTSDVKDSLDSSHRCATRDHDATSADAKDAFDGTQRRMSKGSSSKLARENEQKTRSTSRGKRRPNEDSSATRVDPTQLAKRIEEFKKSADLSFTSIDDWGVQKPGSKSRLVAPKLKSVQPDLKSIRSGNVFDDSSTGDSVSAVGMLGPVIVVDKRSKCDVSVISQDSSFAVPAKMPKKKLTRSSSEESDSKDKRPSSERKIKFISKSEMRRSCHN